MAKKHDITNSSTAEYFSKNLQQVGFSSSTKAVLTTLKESVDNSLDACEDFDILPEIEVEIKKVESLSSKGDLVRIKVSDNGPGLSEKQIPDVFGSFLASSKFGRGRSTRGQQGIGISASTAYAQLTTAKPVLVTTKTNEGEILHGTVDIDIKNNKGKFNKKSAPKKFKKHGTEVVFEIEGKIQINGDSGLLNYLKGTALVNPHLTLKYNIDDKESETIKRSTDKVIKAPEATSPHPHTMKLGEFLSHAYLFSNKTLSLFLRKGFVGIANSNIDDVIGKENKKLKDKEVSTLSKKELESVYRSVQNANIKSPRSKSILTIGEENLEKTIQKIGNVDVFSAVTRKPTVCDFKAVQVEVAIARVQGQDSESPVQVLRFANRVPLQFDKSSCAMTKAIQSVNWKSYGLQQSKNSLPTGNYIICVSLISPFIKFKNASKETVDASDELINEIRLALIQSGQKISKFLLKEKRQAEEKKKLKHIETYSNILIGKLSDILKLKEADKKKAQKGLDKILYGEVEE